MATQNLRLWIAVAAVALVFAAEDAHGQFVNCCLPDGSCVLAEEAACFNMNGVPTNQFCHNCGCAGNCGGSALACYCDSACHNFGDCCDDVCQHCTGPQVPGCSCQGNCGGNSGPFPRCYCDAACFGFGDCCGDVCQHCSSSFPEQCITCTGNTCATAVPTGEGIAPNSSNGLAGCTSSGVAASCAPAGPGRDRWFAYTTSCTGEATASICSEFTANNVAISVFSDCPGQGGFEIACSNTNPLCTGGDANPNANARVTWQSEAGHTYLVRVSVSPDFPGHVFFGGVQFTCDHHDGACCFASHCQENEDFACAKLGGAWLGPLTDCSQCDFCDAWLDLAVGVGVGLATNVQAATVWNGQIVIGGSFTTAGGQPVNRIARWDAASETWQGFGSGMNASVSALTVWNGNLVAGGSFTTAGGLTVNRIAIWNGSLWQRILPPGGGIGVNGSVGALAVYQGDLIVGGQFSGGSGQTFNRIARWDGEMWHPFVDANGLIGLGYNEFTAPAVFALHVYGDDLIVGGQFTQTGQGSSGLPPDPQAQSLLHIARWDGSAWHDVDGGITAGPSGVRNVRALGVYDGELIVGGVISAAGGVNVNRIARWNPSDGWRTLGAGFSGFNNWVQSLTVYNGELIAGGILTASGGQTVNGIARWNGSGFWSPFIVNSVVGIDNPDLQFPIVNALTAHARSLFAGGNFTHAGGHNVNYIANWRDCHITPDCGHPDAGDCFAANDSPSCSSFPCCEAVCAQDPYCCASAGTWDNICAMQAEYICDGAPVGVCGSPLSGPCFEPNSTPSCKFAACCEAVCAEIPFCCSPGGVWNAQCVALANEICTQPGFSNSGGADGSVDVVLGLHGLFELEVEYTNGSIVEGTLCCGLDELPDTVTARFVLDIFDGVGTTPGFHAGPENVVSFSMSFGNLIWSAFGQNSVLVFDATFEIVAPNMVHVTDLIWIGYRLETDGTGVPLNFPLTIRGINADTGEPFEYLYSTSVDALTPTTCDDIGCCSIFGSCGGASAVGCACDADCFARGDCCPDVSTTCAFCPADLNGDTVVDVLDMLMLFAAWGPVPTDHPADLNGDNVVDVLDMLMLFAAWGPCS